MKRVLALIVAHTFFLAMLPPLHAAEEIRPVGMASATGGTSGDIRIGNTCTTSAGGKYYCGLNTRHLLFFTDNTITVDLLYNLAAADTGFPYVLGGTWSIDSLATYRGRLGTGTKDNTTYLRGDGTWSVPPGSDSGDMQSATYDANEDNVVDSAIATAITDGLIVNADINAAADIDGSKMLDNSVTADKVLCSGTKDNTTYLRMDGTCATITTTVAGSTGKIQYNTGSGFGAVSGAGYDNAAETVTLPAVITPSLTASQTASAGCLKLWEGSGGGVEATGFCAPATLADNVYYTLPSADGSANQVLKTNGSKVLSWADAAAASSIPSGANPTVDNVGEIAIDTTSDQVVYFGGAERVLTYQYTKDFVIYGYSASHDNVARWKADTNQTLTQLDCITGGTDNVTVTLWECDANAANCATTGLVAAATSTNANDSSASNGSIDVNDWVKGSLSTLQGTATSVACTVRYVITRQ